MINDVPEVPIGDFENTLSFPSEETSLDSRLPSHLHWEMYHARPAFHTVFSTTQLELPITQLDSLHHGFGYNAYGPVNISKSALMFFRVIRLYDIKNTLSFPSEETSLGSGLSSHLPLEDVPCPSSPSHGFFHHTI